MINEKLIYALKQRVYLAEHNLKVGSKVTIDKPDSFHKGWDNSWVSEMDIINKGTIVEISNNDIEIEYNYSSSLGFPYTALKPY